MDDWYWIRAVMFKGAWLSPSGDVADGRGGTWGRPLSRGDASCFFCYRNWLSWLHPWHLMVLPDTVTVRTPNPLHL